MQVQGVAQTSSYHEGGQNLVNVSRPTRSEANPAIGISLNLPLGANLSSKIKFDTYYVGYFEGLKRGSAFYSNVAFMANNWQVMASYWHSNNFISEFGGDLYQSASRSFGMENYYEAQRELFFLRIIKDWSVIKGMNISLRFEPYYDLRNHLLEHAEGIYVKYGI